MKAACGARGLATVEAEMALYVVVNEIEDGGDDLGNAKSFGFRHRSSAGHPTAQAEFDRRLAAGERVTMIRWQDHRATVIARWDDGATAPGGAADSGSDSSQVDAVDADRSEGTAEDAGTHDGVVIDVLGSSHELDSVLADAMRAFRRDEGHTELPPFRLETAWAVELGPKPVNVTGRYCPGVYAHYGKDGRLYYVGKASGPKTCLENEYWTSPVGRKLFDGNDVDRVVIVPLPEAQRELAYPMEQYLIRALQPVFNTQGK